jgi:fructokinase
MNATHEQSVLSVGEALWDIFPSYRRQGGAPFNVARHLKRFGVRCRFISRVGRDGNGDALLQTIADEGLDVNDIQIDEYRPTGTVRVCPEERGQHSFTISENAAYDHISRTDSALAALDSGPDIIYFGTLAQRTPQGFRELQALLRARLPRSRTLCDINLRPRCYTPETVVASLEQTDILKLNEEEFAEVKNILGLKEDEALIAMLFEKFDLDMIALTRGAAGAELIGPDFSCSGSPDPDINIVDTVGAGDAFAAMLALGVINAWPPEKTLRLSLKFSSSLCGIEGAVPADNCLYNDIRPLMEDSSHE